MGNIKLSDLKNKLVHFVGIGGISMSALAVILKKQGAKVQGSDIAENNETNKLSKLGIKVFLGHGESNLDGVDYVVYSSAIHEDNVEIVFAKNNNIPLIKRAELLGFISSGYKTVIAVAGSHGKTTTTAMLAEIFETAGLKPTYHIGGVLAKTNSNFKLGNKKIFLTEACEYMDNFLFVKPDIAVILNIDSDHLDYFKTLDGVKTSFKKFGENVKDGGIKIVSNDDENSKILLNGNNFSTFGLRKGADIYASNIREYKPCYFSFDVIFSRFRLGNVKLNIIGKHNIANALAAILVSLACAVDFSDIKLALENFSGVKRRSEFVAEFNGATIFHDYAHHPKQIKNMIVVGKEMAQARKGNLIVVFEPHTYSRTKFLFDDFAKAFDGSDRIIFAPAYSAREELSQGVEANELAEAIHSVSQIEFIAGYEKIYLRLTQVIGYGDVVFILGAGTIERLADMFRK